MATQLHLTLERRAISCRGNNCRGNLLTFAPAVVAPTGFGDDSEVNQVKDKVQMKRI
jgi:hypothetical protein